MNTVLMVEDDRLFAALLERRLERRGWRVLCATGIAEAGRQLRAHACDVLLLDIGLPDGSGWDLVAAAPPQVPVVVVTCRDVTNEEIRIYRPARVLQKPLSLADLIQSLERFASRSRDATRDANASARSSHGDPK